MRIVVVNSDKAMARLIRVVLSQAGHDTVLASTAADGESAVEEDATDAVILDADLSDIGGCDLCRDLRNHNYSGPIIFVSGRRDIKTKLRAFENGADDYMVEPFDPQELVARIEVVARRCRRSKIETSPTVLRIGTAELVISELTFHDGDGREVLLTPTEMRLLECLMRNAEKTVTREALIERTWGYDFVGDSNRVEVYVARLRKKIEHNPSEPRFLHTIRGLGYVFRVDSDTTHRTLDHGVASKSVGHGHASIRYLSQPDDQAIHEQAAFDS